MDTISGGEAIIEAVARHGVDTVFGLPGAQIYPLYDALARAEGRIATIACRHEQAAGYMAFGYAASTGRPGVYAVVPGPGVLNTSAALCTAAGCNAPVLCLTGEVPREFLGRRRGHLHELPDQLATLRTLIKWAERIETPADAPRLVGEAFGHMMSGRRGPVALEMCWDSMAETAPVSFAAPVAPAPAPEPDADAVAAAARLLAGAAAPMIMVGGGAQDAGPEVLELAELLDAPVAAFRAGRGVVSEAHALGVSSAAAWQMWPETDALLGIGSRLEMPYMRWTGMMRCIDRPAPPPELVRIDIDADEMTRLVPGIGIVADAADGARALAAAIRKVGRRRRGDRSRIAAAKAEARRRIESIQPEIAYLDVIREVLPDDGFFVEELCQVGFASYYGFPVLTPRTYVTPGYQGTLGFGFPTALGVKAANPDKAVVSITGDGGFMFGLQELATAAQYGIAAVTLVFNNNSYGNVRRDQQRLFQGRVIGADLANPDFVALAESFGVGGVRVDSPDALKPALARALDSGAPALIEVAIPKDSEASPWPFIHPEPPGG